MSKKSYDIDYAGLNPVNSCQDTRILPLVGLPMSTIYGILILWGKGP